MSPRFSSRQLTYLRNQVPISRVIEALPQLAPRRDNKHFECPLCHGFNTSVNAEPNLARCFDCRKNFNTIELVMYHQQISFVESVKWLMQRTAEKSMADPKIERGTAKPTAIGDILASMPITMADTIKDSLPYESILQRLLDIEKSVRHLYRLINELRSSLDQK
jgi:DNA primase